MKVDPDILVDDFRFQLALDEYNAGVTKDQPLSPLRFAYILQKLGVHLTDAESDLVLQQASVDGLLTSVADHEKRITALQSRVLYVDDFSTIQKCFDYALDGDAIVFNGKKTYSVDSPITLPQKNNITLVGNGCTILGTMADLGATVDLTLMLASGCIFKHAIVRVLNGLTPANITAGDSAITGLSSTSGVAVGDIIIVETTKVVSTGTYKLGAFKLATGLTSSTISVHKNFENSLNAVTDSVLVYAYRPIVNFKMSDINFVLPSDRHLSAVFTFYTVGLRAENCTFVAGGQSYNALVASYGFGTRITGIRADGFLDDDLHFGYGVAVSGEDIEVSSGTMKNCKHFITGGAGHFISYGIRYLNNVCYDPQLAALDVHGSCEDVTMSGNELYDIGKSYAAAGVYLRGRRATLSDNKIFGDSAHSSEGVKVTENAYEDISIENNLMHGLTYGVHEQTISVPSSRYKITGNKMPSVTYAVYLEDVVSNLKIANNPVLSAGESCITTQGGSSISILSNGIVFGRTGYGFGIACGATDASSPPTYTIIDVSFNEIVCGNVTNANNGIVIGNQWSDLNVVKNVVNTGDSGANPAIRFTTNALLYGPNVFRAFNSTIGMAGVGAEEGLELAGNAHILNLVPNRPAYHGSYTTSLYANASAIGILTLGGDGANEIRGGNSVAGGYLKIYVNNTAPPTAACNGILAATIDATGQFTFTQNATLYKTDPVFALSPGYGGSYITSLAAPGAKGVLTLGNNDVNEFRLGRTATGGYLKVYVNNTVAPGTSTDGTLALTIAADGKSTFTQDVNLASGKTYNINGSPHTHGLSGLILGGTAGQAVVTGNAGAATLFAPTAGQVIYAGTAGILASSANLIWDNTNSRLGIGNPTLNDQLVIKATVSGQGASIRSTSGSQRLDFAATTSYVRFYGYDDSSGLGLNLALQQYGGNVGIGTTAPDVMLTLGSTLITAQGLSGGVLNIGGSTSQRPGMNIGQDSTHAMELYWTGNATAGNAYASFETSGYLNDFYIAAKTLILQNVSGKNVGIGLASPSAKCHIISTTEQLRIGYDTSNYYKTTVGSTGLVTLDAVGSGAGFALSDPLIVTGGSLYQGTILVDSTSGYSSYGWKRAGTLRWSAYIHSYAEELIFANASGTEKITILQDGTTTFANTVVAPGYKVGANQVVGARITGYTAPSGSSDRASTWDADSPDLGRLAIWLHGLYDDLVTHGLIST